MIQLILHLIGDYVTQSDWMAQNKGKRFWPAFCHAVVYALPFLFIGSVQAVLVIYFTHLLIDRYGLARFVIWAKNIVLAPFSPEHPEIWDYYDDHAFDQAMNEYRAYWDVWNWENCNLTGYPKQSPAWLSVWLMIAADNTLHLAINYAALLWL